ncbi:MAG: hypothetical protein DRQ39_09590 [Gammaproteobacteria bacterium]|nr:MAG: hypothetical protein DRQ39_09590 [Gammaproteobacteria bacterium]
MKLPDVTYSQAQRAQTISPGQAAAPHLAKAQAIGKVASVGLELIDRKKKSDTARVSALYVDSATADAKRLAESDDVTRDELIEVYGMDGTEAGVEWADADGNEKQSFRRYEVEPVVMERMLESRLVEYSKSLPNSEYKTQWMQDTRSANAKAVLRSTENAEKSASAYEYKSALASLEALNGSPQAQLQFAKDTPALDGNPDVRQKYINRAKSSLFHTKANAVINNGTDAEIEAQIDKMKDPESRAKMPVSEKEVRILQSRSQSELDRREREQDLAEGNALKVTKEQQKAREAEAKEAYSDYSIAKSLGMTVPEETELKVEGLVAGTEYQDKFVLLNDVEEFAVLSKADRDSQLDKLNDGSLEDVDRYQAYTKSNAILQEAAAADGYMLGVSQGLIDSVPLDIYSPESVNTRIDQARFLTDHYGVPVSPLTKSDITSISASINMMTAQEQAAMTMTFKQMPEVWSQFAEAGHEVFAWSGASGDMTLATTALSGQKKIASGDVILPSKNDYLLASNEYLGNIYGTEDKSAVMETALAVYAEMAPVGDEGIFDLTSWEKALEMTTGGIGDVNGNKVVIPRSTSADVMQDYADMFSADRVAEFGGVEGMEDDAAAETIQDAAWVSVGDGEYRVDIGNQTLMEKGTGKPFIIRYTRDTALDTAATQYSVKQQMQRKRQSGGVPRAYR